MKDSSQLGPNKTPTQLAPKMTAEMIKGNREFPPSPQDSSVTPFDMRRDYIQTRIPLSTVPLPGTARGMLNSALQALKGNSAAVLVDKLGERLAYERSGARLYDAFLTKVKALEPNISTRIIEKQRQEEVEHFELLRDTIESLGADPTAQTPSADLSGIAGMGLLQAMNDPRTTLPQCVEILLMAEVIDVAAWDLLIELVRDAGLDEVVTKFEAAKAQEDRHEETVREWLRELLAKNEAVEVPELGTPH